MNSSSLGPLQGNAAKVLLAGALVVVLALALRLALLHTARFGGDEALFFGIGCDIVDGKSFPLLGTQITDGAARLPGPTFLYLMALPLFIAKAPEAQYAFVEVLGAVTVGLFWHAMRRPFGERGALFAGVLMALSPWSALYADRTWNPNVLPLVVTLALLAAIRLREDPRSPWLAAFLPLCAVMPHFHMSTPVAWAGLAVLVIPTISRWSRRHLVIGLVLAALLYLPLAAHEIATGFGNTRALFAETVGNKERYPTSFLWVPVYALRFLTLDVTYHELSGYWGGPDELKCLHAAFAGDVARPFHPLRLIAFMASLALALTAVVVAARAVFARAASSTHMPGTRRHVTVVDASALRAPPPAAHEPGTPPVSRTDNSTRRVVALFALLERAPFASAFVVALVANTALMGLTGKQVFGHYVTNLYPFAFVAYAALGAVLVDLRRPFRAVVLACAAIFCAGGVESTLSISRNVDGRIGLHVHRATLEQIRDDGVRDGNSDDSVRLDFGYFSNLWDWNQFALRAMDLRIHFDRRAKTRVYRLVEHDKPLPHGTAVDLDYALLYVPAPAQAHAATNSP